MRDHVAVIAGPTSGRRWFVVALLGLAVWALGCFGAPNADLLAPDERAWLAAHEGQVRLAPLPNWPPVDYFDESGQYRGFLADYLTLLQQRIGFKFTIVHAHSFNQRLEWAQSRQVEIVTTLVRTPERERYLDFVGSSPYLQVPAVIVVKNAVQRSLTLDQMRGMRIVIVDGYSAQKWIKEHYPDLDVRGVESDLDGLRKVSFGEADAVISDLWTATYTIEKEGIYNLRVAGDTGYVYDCDIAVAKHLPVLDRIIRKGMASITSDEQAALYRKWIHIAQKHLWETKGFWWSVGAALVLVTFVFGWNIALKRQVARRTERLKQELAERQRVSEALRLSERKVRAIFDQTFQFMGLVALDGTLLSANQTALEFVGALEADVIGRPVWETPWWNHSAVLQHRLRDAIAEAGRGELVRFDATHVAVTGQTGYFDFSLKPMRNEDGSIGFLVAEGRDVTEYRQAEEERTRLEERLRQAEKMESIGRLAGGVAHDFNNVLTAIMGHVAVLDAELHPNDSLRVHLIEVNKAAESASRITRQLLMFSRNHVIEPTIIDLNATLTHLRAMLAQLAGDRCRLVFTPGTSLREIEVDVAQIEQIAINLVVNARDAMPKGGKITIHTANLLVSDAEARRLGMAGGGVLVKLAVTDTGEGMTPEVQSHLFEPFYTTKPFGKGTGLGLAIVYGAVTQNNGAIEVVSEIGRGTTFNIYFPPAQNIEPLA